MICSRNKKLLGAQGIATRSKDATRAPGLTTRNKKLLAPSLGFRGRIARGVTIHQHTNAR